MEDHGEGSDPVAQTQRHSFLHPRVRVRTTPDEYDIDGEAGWLAEQVSLAEAIEAADRAVRRFGSRMTSALRPLGTALHEASEGIVNASAGTHSGRNYGKEKMMREAMERGLFASIDYESIFGSDDESSSDHDGPHLHLPPLNINPTPNGPPRASQFLRRGKGR